jgi:hypothetical protein
MQNQVRRTGSRGEHLSEVGRKGVWVPLIESEDSAGWALGGGWGGGGVSSEREGKKSMVCKGDGGNKEVMNKGE